jgi:hypothetical protein
MTPRKLPILLASLSLLASAAPAVAQQTTTEFLTLSIPTGRSSSINRAQCLANDSPVSVMYNFPQGTSTTGMDTTITVFLTDSGTCPETAAAPFIISKTPVNQNNLSDTRNIPASVISPEGCPENVTKDWLVCAIARHVVFDTFGGTEERVLARAELSVRYDSEPPPAPTITKVEAGDRTLYVSWNAQDVDDWLVMYRADPSAPAPTAGRDPCEIGTAPDAGEPPDAGETPDAGEPPDAGGEPEAPTPLDPATLTTVTIEDGTATRATLSRLVNGQRYQVVLVARDEADNLSPQSNVVTATPQDVQDFYERYRCDGGSETGGFGCSSAGMALAPLAGLAALALLRRGGRRQQ